MGRNCGSNVRGVQKFMVVAVLVSYNSGIDSLRLSRRLLESGEVASVCIVENGSITVNDDNDSRIILCRPGTNLGYGGGLNFGMAVLRNRGPIDAWIFANPDVEIVASDTVSTLVHAVTECGYDVAGPDLGDNKYLPYARPRTWWDVLLHRYPRTQSRHVFALSGAFLVARESAMIAVGGFDEEFFLYYEEDAFFLLAQSAGLRIGFVPEAKARHIGQKYSTSKERLGRVQESERTYLSKYLMASRAQLGVLAVERRVETQVRQLCTGRFATMRKEV